MEPYLEAAQLIQESLKSGKIVILGILGRSDIVLDPGSEPTITPNYVKIETPDKAIFFVPWEAISYIRVVPP